MTAEIANFLERHPGEVVVVSLSKDFEHRGSLTQPSPLGSHSRFIDFYDFLFEQSRLKDHCAPRPSNPSKATLQEIVDKGKRCIIVVSGFLILRSPSNAILTCKKSHKISHLQTNCPKKDQHWLNCCGDAFKIIIGQ